MKRRESCVGEPNPQFSHSDSTSIVNSLVVGRIQPAEGWHIHHKQSAGAQHALHFNERCTGLNFRMAQHISRNHGIEARP
jgi:hypothetical protein